MHKTMVFGFLFLLMYSCGEKQDNSTEDTTSYEISTKDWPQKTTVNLKSAEILKKWDGYKEFDASFDALYQVENLDDLDLIIEDLITKHAELEESNYPVEFDKPQIKSRLKVVHTFILKIKFHQEYRLDPQKAILDAIKANSIMRKQFDIITNNTVDIKSLLKEDFD